MRYVTAMIEKKKKKSETEAQHERDASRRHSSSTSIGGTSPSGSLRQDVMAFQWLPQVFTLFPSQLRFGGVNAPVFRAIDPHYHTEKRHPTGNGEPPPAPPLPSSSSLPFLDFYHPLQFLLSMLEAIDCNVTVQERPSPSPLSSSASGVTPEPAMTSSTEGVVLHSCYRVGGGGRSGAARVAQECGEDGRQAVVHLLSTPPLHTQRPRSTLHDAHRATRATLQSIFPSLVVNTSFHPLPLHERNDIENNNNNNNNVSSALHTSAPPQPTRRVRSLPPMAVQDGRGVVMEAYHAFKSPSQIRQHLRSAAATAHVFFSLFQKAGESRPHRRRMAERGEEEEEDVEHALACAMEQAILRLRATLSPAFPVDASYVPVIASGRNSLYIHYTDHSMQGKRGPSFSSRASFLSWGEEKEKGEEVVGACEKKGRPRRPSSPRLSRGTHSGGGAPLLRVDAGVSLEHVPTDCTRTFPRLPPHSSLAAFPIAPYHALLQLQRELLQHLHIGVSLKEMDRRHLDGSHASLHALLASMHSHEGVLASHVAPPPGAGVVSDTPAPTASSLACLSLEEVRTIFCPHRFGHPFGLAIHETHPPPLFCSSSSFSASLPPLPPPQRKEPANTTAILKKKREEEEEGRMPVVTPSAGKNPPLSLESGMVYTIEPGFYFPDAIHATLLRGTTATVSPPSLSSAAHSESTPPPPPSSSSSLSYAALVTAWLDQMPSSWHGVGVQVEDAVLLLPPSSGAEAAREKGTGGGVWPRAAYLAAAIDAVQEQDAIVEAASSAGPRGRAAHRPRSTSASSFSFDYFSKVAQQSVPIQIKGGGLQRYMPDHAFLRTRGTRRNDPPAFSHAHSGLGERTGDGGGAPDGMVAFRLRTRLPLMQAMARFVYTQRVSIEGLDEAERHWKRDVQRIQKVCAGEGGGEMNEEDTPCHPDSTSSHAALERVAALTENFSWFPTCCQWYPFDIVVLTACIPKDLEIIRFLQGRKESGGTAGSQKKKKKIIILDSRQRREGKK